MHYSIGKYFKSVKLSLLCRKDSKIFRNAKVCAMDTRLKTLEDKVNDVESSCTFISNAIRSNGTQNNKLLRRITRGSATYLKLLRKLIWIGIHEISFSWSELVSVSSSLHFDRTFVLFGWNCFFKFPSFLYIFFLFFELSSFLFVFFILTLTFCSFFYSSLYCKTLSASFPDIWFR